MAPAEAVAAIRLVLDCFPELFVNDTRARWLRVPGNADAADIKRAREGLQILEAMATEAQGVRVPG